MKDNFSKQSELYAQFRPTYPPELFDFFLSVVPEKKRVWDCGTGNGQVAAELSKYFERVDATDMSESQIQNAVPKENVYYRVGRAEETSFPENYFDLVTVAQAIHWFDFARFYREVERTLKPNGVLAVFGYSLVRADEPTNKVIDYFDNAIIRPYWDKERRYVDEEYRTIPFPYEEIKAPSFKAQYEWKIEQMVGFLNSWSAVQHYIQRNGKNPVGLVVSDLRNSWGSNSTKTVTFPIFVRIGKRLAKESKMLKVSSLEPEV